MRINTSPVEGRDPVRANREGHKGLTCGLLDVEGGARADRGHADVTDQELKTPIAVIGL